MATKRTPIRRAAKVRITPEAIAAFEAMRAARARCTCSPIDWLGDFWRRRPCDACEVWWRAHKVLHSALALRPWEWPAIQDPEEPCPYPAGSYAAGRWRLDERAVALWQQLEEASR
jgi:hypothetical protein